MALILPKGIVVNSPDIEGSIERINAEPMDPEDIAKMWKVYTTTKRRLKDPTAERLENYWWRIWGSRKRELNGATVARLFTHISDGLSFVPLRSAANRDEGSPPLQRKSRYGPASSSAIQFQHSNSSRPSTTSSSTGSRAPAPMPHPILKKSRGPSSGGPRPTARFISPHDSEIEADSPTSPNEHVVVEPPSPDSSTAKSDKKSNGSGSSSKQGRVASTASKKKRPGIVWRRSFQSSADSVTKAAESSEGQPSSFGEPAFAEPSPQKGAKQSKFQENLSPSPEKSPRKRPSSKPSESAKQLLRKQIRKEKSKEGPRTDHSSNGDPGPSTLRNVENQQPEPTEDELEELEVQRIILAEANARVQGVSQAPAQAVRNSNRNLGTGRNLQAGHRSASEGNIGGANRFLPHDSKGNASLAPTLADATGELDMEGNTSDQSSMTFGKGKGRAAGEPPRSNDLFAKRPVPPLPEILATPAVPDAPGSLARSKSQLTLLLEKDKERSKPKDDKKKGKKG